MSMKTQGTDLFAIDPLLGTLMLVGCVTSIDGLDTTLEQIETTCLADSARSYEAGLATPGAATFGINTDPRDPVHIRLHQLKTMGETIKWAIGWSDGKGVEPGVTTSTEPSEVDFDFPENRTWIEFVGFMNSFPFSFAQNAVVASTVGIQVSGEPVWIPKVAGATT